MAQVKLGFGNTELKKAVLKLLDDGSSRDFRSAFACVMHARGVFHKTQSETYNFYFRKAQVLVTRALKARQLKPQASRRDGRQPEENADEVPFAQLFREGALTGFIQEPSFLE
ncbi:MAG: hypothetical protein KBC83_03960 [Candidatus Moranbacteria bacterium]|nr:hypothetical protein [Candidatus Moranbacteria bacterium]MBP9801789.1 hypothetical protein [Candidatus Moranbacteria bacterium]